MKGILGVIVGAIVVLLVIAGVVRYQADKKAENAKAELYIGVTDAAAQMGNISEVSLEITGVSLHHPQKGWMKVSSATDTYNLLALKAENKVMLHSKEIVDAGIYDSVRIHLGQVVVKDMSGNDKKAHLPSKQVTFATSVNAVGQKANYLLLDFVADESLHTASGGEYVFAPAIAVESRSDVNINIASDDTLTSTGGKIDSTAKFAVDLDGVAKRDFKLDTSGTFSVDSKIVGQTKFSLNGKIYEEAVDLEEDSENKQPVDPNSPFETLKD